MQNSNEKQRAILVALDQFERPLLKYATRLLNGNEEAARDAIQHVFLKLCERDDWWDAETSEQFSGLAPWLYTVCRNRVMDHWRKSKRESTSSIAPIPETAVRGFGPADQLERDDLLRLIQDLIMQLAESEKEVVELWSQGFSNPEIVAVTGKTKIAVRVCLHRALKSLRNHTAVQNWLGDEGLVRQKQC